MINIRNRLCNFENCFKSSSYNYKTHKSPIYCSKHKLNDMINVK